jgi:hypothetical protein
LSAWTTKSISPKRSDFFRVLRGRLTIHLRDRDIELEEGELFVVPRGVEQARSHSAGSGEREPYRSCMSSSGPRTAAARLSSATVFVGVTARMENETVGSPDRPVSI